MSTQFGFDTLRAPVTQLTALTPAGIERVTGLKFRECTDVRDLTLRSGVYAWAESYTGPTYYVGAARGAKGLRGRLGNEWRWKDQHLGRLASGLHPFDAGVATQVPLVRTVAELQLTPFVAEAVPAPWGDGDLDIVFPENALSWERFVQECSAIITGHRSVIGGGAWENKSGGLGDLMQTAANWRLHQLFDRA